jgi:hypothetical protein
MHSSTGTANPDSRAFGTTSGNTAPYPSTPASSYTGSSTDACSRAHIGTHSSIDTRSLTYTYSHPSSYDTGYAKTSAINCAHAHPHANAQRDPQHLDTWDAS